MTRLGHYRIAVVALHYCAIPQARKITVGIVTRLGRCQSALRLCANVRQQRLRPPIGGLGACCACFCGVASSFIGLAPIGRIMLSMVSGLRRDLTPLGCSRQDRVGLEAEEL